jgi:F1F0 ATPase subunit 2
MDEPLMLVLACVEGALLGAMFFGGLWWTVRKAVGSRQPALWFFGSLMLRMSVTSAGLFVASGGRWQRLLLSLLGFVVANGFVRWLIRPSGDRQGRLGQEASHAAYPR